jgi:hypothetical protein
MGAAVHAAPVQLDQNIGTTPNRPAFICKRFAMRNDERSNQSAQLPIIFSSAFNPSVKAAGPG